MNEIRLLNKKRYYTEKIEDINFLETNDYKGLDVEQKEYEKKIHFYKDQKDRIKEKLRMLEVYQDLWKDLYGQINNQVVMSEEFWNSIGFHIMKYNAFNNGLSESECDQHKKDMIEPRVNAELWKQRKDMFLLMKEDISLIHINFDIIHNEIYNRTLLQKQCIEKHIEWMMQQYETLEAAKQSYKTVFYEIQEEIGQRGNKISKRSLRNYKKSLLQKIERITKQLCEKNSEITYFSGEDLHVR